jgi:hypothetical protein
VTEPDFRARSGNHIDRDSKFARALPTVIFRAGALSKRLLEIASTLLVYSGTLHHGMLLGEASRPVGVWVLVSRRLNGQERITAGERPMPNRQDRTAGGFDQAALTGTPTAPVETRSAHRGQGHVLREPLPVSHRYLRGPLGEPTRWAIGISMRDSDRAWVALAGGVAAYDLIATDDEQVTNAARRYFKSQPIATASMVVVTGLQLVGGIPPWCNSITLTFAAW